MKDVSADTLSASAVGDEFCVQDLLMANAGTEWSGMESLMPFERGMVVVERIGHVRRLAVIVEFDDDTVRTHRGFIYTREGIGLTIDGIHRSLTSPQYHIKRLTARAEAA